VVRKKKAHVRNAEPQVSNYHNEDTVYVYGRHYIKKINNYSDEYVWRMPKKMVEECGEDYFKIGDIACVNTKYGLRYMMVTRIKKLSNPPIDQAVLKIKDKVIVDED
jgi:hypothetical protein